MKPKHKRLIAVLSGLAIMSVGAAIILVNFRQNIVFFYTPMDLKQQSVDTSRSIRVGGLVEVGSIQTIGENKISFTITDNTETLNVHYTGLLPALFREGQGVVAEGKLTAEGALDAKTILAKHDENYMPKEVADAIKKSGQWKESAK